MKRTNAWVIVVVIFLCGCSSRSTFPLKPTDKPILMPTQVPITLAPPVAGHLEPIAHSDIMRLWANEGGDKVTRDELRASLDPGGVLNTVWDGTGITLFGARNEVIAFNLVLEASMEGAEGVEVSLTELTGPGEAKISTKSAKGGEIFNFVDRNIELFYVRYLQIRGLSYDLAYDVYDERHIPERCRRSFDTEGDPTGTWEDRPCHDKFYPEIAVPLELHSPFQIPTGTNQAIWGDIYIPKETPAGDYVGVVVVRESGVPTWQVPIHLKVRGFTLPDLPYAKTMLFFNSSDVADRYLGEENLYPEPGSAEYDKALMIGDRHFQLAHRHKISLINEDNDYVEVERMGDAWAARLSGELFTRDRGYDGVGTGVGNNVYSIGTYGDWPWQDGSRGDMWTNTDAWVNWFEAQAFPTPTTYFLYLIDESDDYAQIERWAQWMDDNPGPGHRLMSMATIDLPSASAYTPSLDIPTSNLAVGITEEWQIPADDYTTNPEKRFYYYNGTRPASGSFAIEDEGVALRVSAWSQFKMNIDRWFYWESTYYNNFQCSTNEEDEQTNVFQQAQTYGCYEEDDEVLGETGWNYFNGDGVLFYPGTDTRFPNDSYDLMGPFASLRLKLWRRGIQDVDYLNLAAAVDPEATSQIVSRIIPKVLWEYGVEDPDDPTWKLTDISWSIDPDVWEIARAELADLIEGAQ